MSTEVWYKKGKIVALDRVFTSCQDLHLPVIFTNIVLL